MDLTRYEDFGELFEDLIIYFLDEGKVVDVGEWQSFRDPNLPMTQTYEVEDVSFKYWIPFSRDDLQRAVKPNLPWAERHFQERMSGLPLNPGNEYKNWPWYKQGVEDHKPDGQFSHTYMERYWPKFAGENGDPEELKHFDMPNHGIHFPYGDVDNLINLLQTRPYTRQAYLPIWFPEDLHAADVAQQRVPCTLGYHFLIRKNPAELKVTYYMRSCDFFRYFRDDVYMTCRLAQIVADRVGVLPGDLVMHISSLHIFEAEIERLENLR
jgi:Thymidylate synthase